jgi:hypothetical protein
LEQSAVDLEFALHAKVEEAPTHGILPRDEFGKLFFKRAIQLPPCHYNLFPCTEELHDALFMVAREDN